jgi:hypothetical protein
MGVFRLALLGRSAPFSILYVYGLGGIGKSTVLHACANEAARAGMLVVRLDARHIEPSRRGFLHALGEALELPEGESPVERVSQAQAVVVTLDSYDAIAPLDAWIRETLLPSLPPRGVMVIAGRQPPSAEWTTDPVLGPIFHALPLRNLQPPDSRALLSERGVPDDQHAAVLNFTHGHPLALALVADVIASAEPGAVPFTPEHVPNVVRELLTRLVAAVPSPLHRQALELCAQVRVSTEPLIAAVIDGCDPHDVFEWLRGLSFIEQGPEGLFPHDAVREALDVDFRWRNPDGYREMHRRVWRHLRHKVLTTTGRAQQRVFFDKLFLHRASAVGLRSHHYSTLGSVYAQPAAPEDRPAIIEVVRRHEGDESARIAAYWLDCQHHSFRIARGSRDDMLGFVASLTLNGDQAQHSEADPGVRAAWAFARRHGHLRAGETMVHHRFHMACHDYQAMSPNINLLAMRATFAPLEHQRLAWSFVAFACPDDWLPVMQYINFKRVEEAAFTVGGRCYTVFAHDWRVESFAAWWDGLCERSLSTEPVGEDVAPLATAPTVLSEQEFATSVRDALRHYSRPAALAENPLLLSRRLPQAANGHGPSRLQALLRDALDTLNTSPRDQKFHRALLTTYFQPAPTQEAAAERLGLPFNTYRYHLARGTQRIVEWLWRLELSRDR